MDDNGNTSQSAALQAPEFPKPEHEEDKDIEGDDETEEAEDEDDDDEKEFVDQNQTAQIGVNTTKKSKLTRSETLNLPHDSDHQSDYFITSSHLSDVPVEYTLQSQESPEKFKQSVVSVATRVTQNNEVHLPNHLQLHGCQNSSLELSPTSVTQSILSVPSPNLKEQRVAPLGKSNGVYVAKVNQEKVTNTVSSSPSVKASSIDGYNWRKYGQKQVKSPKGSRSYYKCTYSECKAKKIECCDNSNSVIEVIYRSDHNHDPPQKINCTREQRLALPVAPSVGSDNCHPVRTLSNMEPATSSGEIIQENPIIDAKQQKSVSSDGNVQMNVVEEVIAESEAKHRVKKSSTSYPDPITKPGKKPKFIVHAAGDVGISGDGYRWRKYGQKMVKGTPHPRNYYRCTSAGCPVRKHIEMANDKERSVVITYKGIHDHDMPVPKKRHGPPSVTLLAASAPVSMNSQVMKPEALQNEISATQWSVDKKGELTGEKLELAAENAIESAKTLLSIGFEIKPC